MFSADDMYVILCTYDVRMKRSHIFTYAAAAVFQQIREVVINILLSDCNISFAVRHVGLLMIWSTTRERRVFS